MALVTAETDGATSGGLVFMVTAFDVADRGGLALSVTLAYNVCEPDAAM